MVDHELIEGVHVLRMCTDENRFNPAFVTALSDALDDAADPGGPLVLTGTGKFFSNGLDLDWLGSATADDRAEMFRGLHGVFARLLRFPGATVAAINGHAFGAGAILAAAADFRVQRSDRGYFCFPEVDIGMSMSVEFDAVINAKLPSPAVLKGLLTGQRWGAADSLAAGLVDATASDDDVLPTALRLVQPLVGKNPATVAAIKAQQHKTVLAVLEPAP